MGVACDEARITACRMLQEVLENQGYSNLVIKQELRGSTISSRDRAFATALFYGTITRVHTLDYVLNHYLKKDISTLKPLVRTCLRMGAWQILFSYGVKAYAAVDSSVALIKSESNSGAAGLVNAVLRRVASEGKEYLASIPQKNLAARYSLKPEIAGCFQKWFGREKAESILQAFLSEPEVTIRRNILRSPDQESFMKMLQKDGIDVTANTEVPDSYTIHSEGKDISETSAFAEGFCSVQSLSAMLVAHILEPRPGESVLDTCSAPGGKTTHIAELMQGQGRIDALDASAIRLSMVDEAAERLGISIIHTFAYDATYLTEEKDVLASSYDHVLCDVPCSGLGLLHRKPDIRLSMTYEKIQSLIPVQKSILENSAARVKTGGTLIYSTCTIDPLENERQIEVFLSEHSDFETVPFDMLLSEELSQNERLVSEASAGMMTLLPDEGAFDGFFIAKLRRKQNG